MAPTICSDKKRQARSGGIMNLRRQARGLQRSNGPTSTIINYVAKGALNVRGAASTLRMRATSTANSSNADSDLGSSIGSGSERNHNSEDRNERLQQLQQEHIIQLQQQQQRPLSSKQQISDSLVTSSTSSVTATAATCSHSSSNANNNITLYSNRAATPTLSVRSLSPCNATMYSDSETDDYIDNDDDFDVDVDDNDAHSMFSDYSDDVAVADVIAAVNPNQNTLKNHRHQTVFNAPAYGDKQLMQQHQHTSVICSTKQHYNSNNNNSMLVHGRDSYSDLCEIKNTEGLLSIAIKTIKLVKRNQMLQRRLTQLQLETSEFIQSVLANPENRHFREKLQQKSQHQQQQQPQIQSSQQQLEKI